MPSLPSSPLTPWCAVALLAAVVPAQQVRPLPPAGAIAPVAAPAPGPGDDPGTPVEMFENPNLDRYLRRAHSFLDRADYVAAIQVLQDVVDGRTTELLALGPEAAAPAPPPGGEAGPVAAPPGPAIDKGPAVSRPPDARNAVFSEDGRLYRPVRRLCHELLARMPDVGIEIYRTTYEVAADELLQAASRDGDIPALEQVANRYFVTLPAGRAMALLADRLMHEGRYRAAVQVLRDLLEVYPATNRRRLGISEVWCRFKIALCLRLAGETDAAHAAVAALAADQPRESLRLLGELQSVADLPASALFARDLAAVPARAPATAPATCLAGDDPELVPLWQYRFRNPTPYRDPKASTNERQVFFDGGPATVAMPFAGRYGPATWVALGEPGADGQPRAAFLEHFRLRLADATTGLLLAQGDGVDEPPPPRDGHARVRIAAVDFAQLRPIDDGQRRYVVLGHQGATSSSAEPLRTTTLVAYDRDLGQRLWDSRQWLDGEGGLRDVTLLAAPTVFGERLLLPSLRRGAYTLECLDRTTGRPLWNTPLHGGGTPFWKAPGCPVVVQGGVAFVATNAGALAAVDAFAGELRWIRRYERADPRRAMRQRRPGRGEPGWARPQVAEEELAGFHPNDLVVRGDLVVLAPCDSELLLGIDGASGRIAWYVDATTRYAPYGRLRQLVGVVGDDLFALSDTHLVAIGASGGLVKWARELPVWTGPKTAGRGRAAVAGDWIVVPGERELIAVHHAGGEVRRVSLPPFDDSREPLAGSRNVVAAGPWLALGYQGGVELYSSRSALRELAAASGDARRRATYLSLAGDDAAAIAVVADALRAGRTPAGERRALMGELLLLAREGAWRRARGGDLAGALAELDAVQDLLTEREVRVHWHLARVEICREAGDLRAHEREQLRLYDCMEGKS